MSEHSKFLMARCCQWIFYCGSVGFLMAFAFQLNGFWVIAPFAGVMVSNLAMIASPFILTCGGCDAGFFDIPLSLSEGMMGGRWKMTLAMWRPVPKYCQSCGLSRA